MNAFDLEQILLKEEYWRGLGGGVEITIDNTGDYDYPWYLEERWLWTPAKSCGHRFASAASVATYVVSRFPKMVAREE